MAQELISLTLDPATLTAMDKAITQLEAACTQLDALDPDVRRRLLKMGPRLEPFYRQSLATLTQNPQIVPSTLNVNSAMSDLATLDALRPRQARLRRVMERMDDTSLALGSDIASAALEGYALLKVSGKTEGLKGPRQALGSHFKGRGTRRGTTAKKTAA